MCTLLHRDNNTAAVSVNLKLARTIGAYRSCGGIQVTTLSYCQFETLTAQSKELATLAQKVATETVEPVKESVSKAFKKVA